MPAVLATFAEEDILYIEYTLPYNKFTLTTPDVVTHACYPSTWEIEVGG